MPRRKDIWQIAIVERTAAQVALEGVADAPCNWLPAEPDYSFIADPFGLWHGGDLTVFVEQYDYRARHGVIEKLSFDASFRLQHRHQVLREPWHLSYPFVFEHDGATWMLPEAHRSGSLRLYRAQDGQLDHWQAECEITLDTVPVDASLLHHDEMWWLFYCSARDRTSKISDLHVAWAPQLQGPWTPHPGNPVRRDPASSRPGGTPLVIDGQIMLPVQDCSRTYGGAIRPLWINRLNEREFSASIGGPLEFPAASPSDCEGMHTLSACGPVTLIDVKTIDRSLSGLRIELGRMLGKYADR